MQLIEYVENKFIVHGFKRLVNKMMGKLSRKISTEKIADDPAVGSDDTGGGADQAGKEAN